VSLETHGRVDPSPDDRECSGCIERDEADQRLGDELAASKGERTIRRGVGWWCLLVFGLCLLALLPHPVFLLASALEDGGDDALLLTAMGVLCCVPVTQYSVVGMVMALHWRPRWQRLMCGVAVASLFVTVSLGPYHSSDNDTWEILCMLAPVAPIAIVISVFPVLLQRALFRWTIALRGQSIRPIPVALSSFLLFMGMWGFAIACLRLTDPELSDGSSTAELAALFLMHVGIPAATTGILFAVFLPAILQQTRRPHASWGLRVMATVVVTVSGPAVLYLIVWALEPDDTSLDMEMVQFLGGYGFGVAGTAIFVAVSTILWMRLLGYQLLSTAKPENTIGQRSSA
jgi:hypothetical protein